ncbi:hypothetical protein DFH09DRAFT_1306483 [Mycena vulgaris]|nr:hypothetical protein DFH09DRAFT_1306483 [Mycena vulgaris]
MQRKSALSAKVKVSYGSRFNRASQSHTVKVNKSASERAHANKVYNDQIAQMGFLQREELLADAPMSNSHHDDVFDLCGNDSDSDAGWCDDNRMDVDQDEDGFLMFPPGEEGLLQSHAGGEAIFHKIWDRAKPGRGDSRKHRYRVQKQVDSWTCQLPVLIDPYLKMKLHGPILTADDVPGVWYIQVLGFSESGTKAFAYSNNTVNANQVLLHHGYIGGSPNQPTIAFSIETFEIYRQIHRTCPRFSLDALAKVLNYLHMVPRRAYLAEQLTTGYDTYLAILRGVDRRVQAALKRDEEWKAKNICPPCFYKIGGEPKLLLSWLGSLDGNNSLKLVDSTFLAGNPRFDNRKTDSFRWLTAAAVNVFKDEVADSEKIPTATAELMAAVKAALAAPPGTVPTTSESATTPATPATGSNAGAPTPGTSEMDLPNIDADDIAWLNINELNEAESDELEKCVNTCVERWKNAGPEVRKQMFALFAITGIFIVVCRHGHVLVMCDMIRNGELMKYPIAVVKRLLDVYGADAGIGYNIMCVFYKTLLCSTMGHRVVALRLRGVVPAFHDHAHNRACQIGWHPLYVEGVGLEDFEECERTFCLSNNLATVTQLSSGNFIFQNYRQATEKIALNEVHLQALKRELHTTADDYEMYLIQECEHLERLKREPPEVVWTVEYMELLVKNTTAHQASSDAACDFRNLDYHIIYNGWTAKQIQAVRTKYRTTHTRCLMLEELSRHEEEHGIVYRLALNELERLVVQRLLEMTKLGMSGVAYKLREKIGKALAARATAIRHALTEYNVAAVVLDPPRSQVTWAEVQQLVSVADFDLLRDMCTDIHKLPWADPICREAMVLYFGIKHSKEELLRLNVEIRRLITFMIDDHVDYVKVIRDCILPSTEALGLAHELSKQWIYRSNINQGIVERLVKASRLVGFTGSLFPGKREGRDPRYNDDVFLPEWATSTLRLTEVIVEHEEDEEGNNAEDTARELRDVDTDLLEHVMDNLHL